MTKPGPITSNCAECKAQISVWPYQLKTKRYCSRACVAKGTHTGVKRSEETCKKISENRTPHKMYGEDNPAWRGEAVSYSSLHKWARRHVDEKHECSFCGKEITKLHLANISHQYLRDTDDWEYLCVPCHKKFDLEFIRIINSAYEC